MNELNILSFFKSSRGWADISKQAFHPHFFHKDALVELVVLNRVLHHFKPALELYFRLLREEEDPVLFLWRLHKEDRRRCLFKIGNDL